MSDYCSPFSFSLQLITILTATVCTCVEGCLYVCVYMVHECVWKYSFQQHVEGVSVDQCTNSVIFVRGRARTCVIFMHVCLLDTSGCEVHSGGPPKRKMNNSGRVMWVSRPFRFNYELITRQDHHTGRRAAAWGGETKESNNTERSEGWKLVLKLFSTLVDARKYYTGRTSSL